MTRMLEQLDARTRDAARRGAGHADRIEPGRDARDSGGRPLRDRVDRLVLLAPAVMFAKPAITCSRPNGSTSGGGPARSRSSTTPTAKSGRSTSPSTRTRSATIRSTRRSPSRRSCFRGLRDASVDYRTVEQFARARPNVTLSLLDDDHQLTASLPRIWDGIGTFPGTRMTANHAATEALRTPRR